MSLASLIKESMRDKEAWHYTSLVPYAGMDLKLPASNENVTLPSTMTSQRLVFVNGKLSDALSSIEGLPDALVSVDGKNRHYKLVLGGQACLAIEPLELLYINTDEDDGTEVSACLDIELGENSRLTLIERHFSEASALQVRHHKTSIQLAAQSKLVHGRFVSGNAHTLHVGQAEVSVSEGAFYDHFCLTTGGKLVRHQAQIDLDAKLAEARMIGCMLLRDKDHGDITTMMNHNAPYCNSHQVCKSVLGDCATAVFQGKAYVAKDAQKTDAYQLCQGLLLSRQSEMNAKPELEIYADDVKCSHGAAIGDLDEDALFYLVSRGIDKETARSMLIDAFVRELIDNLQSKEMAALAGEEVRKWLSM